MEERGRSSNRLEAVVGAGAEEQGGHEQGTRDRDREENKGKGYNNQDEKKYKDKNIKENKGEQR